MSDSAQREWRLYIDDMIGFAEKVISYTSGLDQTGFVASGLNFDATLRNLELIGEAATHVPEAVRGLHPQIPWRLVIATRNRLIHGYLGIDNDTLWSIIRGDVPGLLERLRALTAARA
ncbi:MAG: DUF86 domain-containing protein [Betaproteobacteria bacterium]